MTILFTNDGEKSKLSAQELAYLQSFLTAGDRGGFYMAYYAMVSNTDFGSTFGKTEASLQTMIATFSGQVGAGSQLYA